MAEPGAHLKSNLSFPCGLLTIRFDHLVCNKKNWLFEGEESKQCFAKLREQEIRDHMLKRPDVLFDIGPAFFADLRRKREFMEIWYDRKDLYRLVISLFKWTRGCLDTMNYILWKETAGEDPEASFARRMQLSVVTHVALKHCRRQSLGSWNPKVKWKVEFLEEELALAFSNIANGTYNWDECVRELEEAQQIWVKEGIINEERDDNLHVVIEPGDIIEKSLFMQHWESKFPFLSEIMMAMHWQSDQIHNHPREMSEQEYQQRMKAGFFYGICHMAK